MRRLRIALCTLALAACGTDRCNTPFGEGGTLDVAQFAELYNVGGSVIINRGHRGILVRRVSYSDFVAFECACPKDVDVRLQPDDGWGNSLLTCSVCGSRFETEYGNPIEGSATGCPLYQYTTYFDGQQLTIN